MKNFLKKLHLGKGSGDGSSSPPPPPSGKDGSGTAGVNHHQHPQPEQSMKNFLRKLHIGEGSNKQEWRRSQAEDEVEERVTRESLEEEERKREREKKEDELEAFQLALALALTRDRRWRPRSPSRSAWASARRRRAHPWRSDTGFLDQWPIIILNTRGSMVVQVYSVIVEFSSYWGLQTESNASALNPLERMLTDERAEPTKLPLPLLQSITNHFSDDLQIGEGGFAVVYKGLLQNGAVAVKKLHQRLDMDEAKYNREINSLMRMKHKNIVRFLGYCYVSEGEVWNINGNNVMAEERQRFLCFEYLPEGSLDNYIIDASQGLDWITRYPIIRGICDGLHYLHQQNIVHLDLKPANILLDHDKVPKIADFGISRCFAENQTHTTTSILVGSPGYMAPESYGGLFTMKSDIYSLGVIIIEILTGQKGYPQMNDFKVRGVCCFTHPTLLAALDSRIAMFCSSKS